MNKRILIAFVAAIVITVGILYFRFGYLTEEATFKRQTNQFIGCLPEPLSDEQKEEVKMILDRFRHAVKRGEASNEDIDEVVSTLKRTIDRGSISAPELKVFMARVSYLSFRNRPEHHSEEGEILPPDHPLLMDDSTSIAE